MRGGGFAKALKESDRPNNKRPLKSRKGDSNGRFPFRRTVPLTKAARQAPPYLSVFTALSAATTPETIAQEFIMAVIESAPFAPPTTQPAP